ncbi:TRAP transporter substrate-binding protein [Pseudodesulfovibrio indicus]|uniref:C4-dicarboxylate ABC transporter substrate-binding protein n=1 Tax=Pseudodesulfovibrio indicus TaxID=1716143 RepID=A0A126QMR3_9BACT|nr:TRAP transporter substrate-binding protein [Pseudodesulfovibrio indicus]AMK10735.1 C4-dicarboxylate ABC transporter substrate-binding protein [Pseudodesulfovibrio indicus]TDT91720.1 TRAP-type C4-dicarboxylate transport system substrate-binding protein [Pseudodesulfovibrio indicus]
MRKTLFTLTAIALFLFGLTSVACAESVRLTYSSFFPPTHVQSRLAEQWCAEVEARTGKAVIIDFYPGGTLTKAKQTYDGVVEGISDIGQSCLAYSRGRFPVMAAVDLPMGYKNGVQATDVANAVYTKFSPAEFDDVQPMYFHAHGPGLLFTTEKPVRTLADLNGLKIRSTGNSAKLIEALGGTPVAQPMPASYQSLQKGVVDGSVHPMESNKGWKLGEVVRHCTLSDCVGYTTTFFVVMNKDKWAMISPENQQIILQINAEWALKHGQAWDEADAEGKEFLTSKGGDFIELEPAEAERWVKAAQPVLDGYAAGEGKAVDGQAVVDFIKGEMTKSP